MLETEPYRHYVWTTSAYLHAFEVFFAFAIQFFSVWKLRCIKLHISTNYNNRSGRTPLRLLLDTRL